MNNKIFISGKITGDPNYVLKFESACITVCHPDFFDRYGVDAAQRLGRFGFKPVDPCDFTFLGHPMAECSWSICMMVCLWHLTWCSYVYFLNDWKDSRGANMEHRWARLLKKKVIYQ